MNSRRGFLGTSALGAAAATAAACTPSNKQQGSSAIAVGLSPELSAPLSPVQIQTLGHICDVLVPGSKQAGVAVYITQQLSRRAENNLLMLQYLGVAHADMQGFYSAGLNSIERMAQVHYKQSCLALDAVNTKMLVGSLLADEFDDWSGAPASFCLFVLRADACDVTYGTQAGFARIDMPHMAHIAPVEEW